MKRKLSTKQKLLLFLIVETVFLFFVTHQVISSFFPGNKTYKANTCWRSDPAWKGGLNTTYRLAKDFSFQNISYPNLNLVMMKDNTGYWINVTSGSNAQISIDKWFESTSPEVQLTYSSSGSFNTRLYVGSKGRPTSVIGVSSWDWNSPYVDFQIMTPGTVLISWEGELEYDYTFRGLFNETTGLRIFDRNVTVTAHFVGAENATESFILNGTYQYQPDYKPLYFHYELGDKDREYWLGDTETLTSIYVFNETLTTYTIEFVDLAGVLEDYSFVTAERYVNGTLRIVEKRNVDIKNNVVMSLINGVKYTITVQNGASYVFGDLLMTSTTLVTLTLRGIDFPQNIILAFRYVRIYAERHNNFTSISLLYEDLDENTNSVNASIYFQNGTIAYTTLQTADSFNVTWTSAWYNTTYIVRINANHGDYGAMNYHAVMYRGGFNQVPWSLDFLGTIPGMNTSDLIPIFLIFVVAGLFSKVNAFVGAFMAVIMGLLLAWLGWISIPPALAISALFFTILMGLAAKKKGVTFR